MTTAEPIRLSPSGARIGFPGARKGPGSTNVIARAHGAASGSSSPLSNVTTPIAGLDAVAADIRPGYLYELETYVEVDALALSVSGVSWDVYYRLRDKASGTWSSWLWTNNATHGFYLSAGASVLNERSAFREYVPGLSVTAICDQVAIGIAGVSSGATTVMVQGAASWLRLTEYLP